MSLVKGGPNLVTDGLVLHLDAANTKSYPGTGTNWFDLSKNQVSASLINGPLYNSANNGVIIFDSSNDQAIINFNEDLNLCNKPNWTITVWLKLTDSNGVYNCIIAQWPQDTDDAWLLAHSNGTVGFVWAPYSRGAYMLTSSTPMTVGNWTNIVLRKSANNFTLFQNLLQVGSFTNAGKTTSSYRIELGRYGGSAANIGAQYSLVTIQHKALSIEEITQNYNATKGRFGLP